MRTSCAPVDSRFRRFSADLNGSSWTSPRRTKAPQKRGFRLAYWEADDGTRTHDTWLGKPVLYQLSYVRAPRILAL